MTLDEEIQNQEEQAMAYKSMGNKLSMNTSEEQQFRASECYHLSNYYLQIAKWLKELKAYKELDTYNRSSKCSECEFEDSAYYCDDCIWNFVNKFKQKEVSVDGDSD